MSLYLGGSGRRVCSSLGALVIYFVTRVAVVTYSVIYYEGSGRIFCRMLGFVVAYLS